MTWLADPPGSGGIRTGTGDCGGVLVPCLFSFLGRPHTQACLEKFSFSPRRSPLPSRTATCEVQAFGVCVSHKYPVTGF